MYPDLKSKQTLLDIRPGLSASYAAGAAQILKCRVQYGPRSDFEKELCLSMRDPVVRSFRAILRSSYFLQVIAVVSTVDMEFTPRQCEEIVEPDLDDGTPEAATISCLAKIPDLFRRGRYAKSYYD